MGCQCLGLHAESEPPGPDRRDRASATVTPTRTRTRRTQLGSDVRATQARSYVQSVRVRRRVGVIARATACPMARSTAGSASLSLSPGASDGEPEKSCHPGYRGSQARTEARPGPPGTRAGPGSRHDCRRMTEKSYCPGIQCQGPARWAGSGLRLAPLAQHGGTRCPPAPACPRPVGSFNSRRTGGLSHGRVRGTGRKSG